MVLTLSTSVCSKKTYMGLNVCLAEVLVFITGYFAVNTIDNVPCFVYATFNNKIYIYYNISLPQVESTNLIEVMENREETRSALSKLNIKCKSCLPGLNLPGIKVVHP